MIFFVCVLFRYFLLNRETWHDRHHHRCSGFYCSRPHRCHWSGGLQEEERWEAQIERLCLWVYVFLVHQNLFQTTINCKAQSHCVMKIWAEKCFPIFEFPFDFGRCVDDKHQLNGQNSDWKMKEASCAFTVWSFSITSERTDELKNWEWEGERAFLRKFNWIRWGNQYPCIACWTTEKNLSFPPLCLFFQQIVLNLVSTICFNCILDPAVWDVWLHRILC